MKSTAITTSTVSARGIHSVAISTTLAGRAKKRLSTIDLRLKDCGIKIEPNPAMKNYKITKYLTVMERAFKMTNMTTTTRS